MKKLLSTLLAFSMISSTGIKGNAYDNYNGFSEVWHIQNEDEYDNKPNKDFYGYQQRVNFYKEQNSSGFGTKLIKFIKNGLWLGICLCAGVVGGLLYCKYPAVVNETIESQVNMLKEKSEILQKYANEFIESHPYIKEKLIRFGIIRDELTQDQNTNQNSKENVEQNEGVTEN